MSENEKLINTVRRVVETMTMYTRNRPWNSFIYENEDYLTSEPIKLAMMGRLLLDCEDNFKDALLIKSPTKASLEKCAEAVVQMAFDNKTEALHDQLAKDIAKAVLDAAGVEYE